MKFDFEAIGFVRSPFVERVEAPRQPSAEDARGVAGRIELLSGFEHALSDLDEFTHLWVLFVFHRNVEQGRGWKPKVQPPRAERKKGVFATRSPHRPNPIGLSVVKLVRVDGLSLHVEDLDMLDGTPVLDLKPYIPYADAVPQAGAGWLGRDPEPPWEVHFAPLAAEQLSWLRSQDVELEQPVRSALSLGPHPNPYRRIRREPGGGMRMAWKEWRVFFDVDRRTITVRRIASGYRPAEQPPIHAAFARRF